MSASVALVLLIALSGEFKKISGEGWTNTFSVPQLPVGNSRAAIGDLCDHPGINVAQELLRSVNTFTINLYQQISIRAKDHCVITPLTVWLSLAAMAEGVEGLAQQELLRVLNLPEDACLRQKYYELAVKREITGADLKVYSSRILAIDETLSLNQLWSNSVRGNSLLNPVPLPIRRDPAAAVDTMRELIAARIPKINMDGNSVLLGSFDYQGLWSSAFSDAITKQAPFYNDFGQQIGNVDLMTIKKRVAIAYLPEQQLKVLVLPVGYNNRYCIMLGLSVKNTRNSVKLFTETIVLEILNNMRLSRIPIEVAVPRYSMRTELDLRDVLEDMGVKSLWSDPSASRNISTPAAVPSSYIHRATITVNNAGVEAYKEEQSDAEEVVDEGETGVDLIFGRDFIANRPFMFGLFDTDIYSCLFANIFSHPPDSFVSFN